MNTWKRQLSVFLIVTLVFTLSILSVANADNVGQKVQAYLGVKVQYNGQVLTGEKQPYIINDTTYIPLRMLMDKFGKDISFDKLSNKVIIKDKENTNVVSLNKKLAELNDKITKLQKENTSLTTKNKALNSRITELMSEDDELNDIEDKLQDEYETAGDEYFDDDDISFSIKLDGNEDELDFEVYLDFDDSNENDDMPDLSKTYIRNLMKDIYEDFEEYIEDTDYEDADIIGYFEDDSGNDVEYAGRTFDFSW